MAVNEKVIYIYTCFNGVAIKEWINIYKAVIEFIQVVSILVYEKNQETVKVKIKEGRGGKRRKGGERGVADKVILLQIIICFRYMMLINVKMFNCKYLKCMYDKYNNVHKFIILCKTEVIINMYMSKQISSRNRGATIKAS